MTATPDFTVSPAAAKFMRRMVRFSDHPTGGFRLSVTPGGCSGYASEFSVEPAPRDGDAELLVNGEVKLYLPAESRLLLHGAAVDFAESPTTSGLVFSHPSASSCGCSSAAEAAPPAQATVALADLLRRKPKA